MTGSVIQFNRADAKASEKFEVGELVIRETLGDHATFVSRGALTNPGLRLRCLRDLLFNPRR